MKTEKLDSLIERAKAADLDGLDFLSSYEYGEIAAAYNGIGPEWMPADLREKVSGYLDLFAPAALIHDMRYQMSDGSRYGFSYANMEFHENCLKLADHAYPWWNWRRYRARLIAHVLYDFVRGGGGWKAWIDCYERKTISTDKPNGKDNKC